MNTPNVKQLLDQNHQWPCHFTFKFVVPTPKEQELAKVFAEDKVKKKNSKTGKYVSYTVQKMVTSGQHVLDVYASVKHIEGVVSL